MDVPLLQARHPCSSHLAKPQKLGLISQPNRGHITGLDRPLGEPQACECYACGEEGIRSIASAASRDVANCIDRSLASLACDRAPFFTEDPSFEDRVDVPVHGRTVQNLLLRRQWHGQRGETGPGRSPGGSSLLWPRPTSSIGVLPALSGNTREILSLRLAEGRNYRQIEQVRLRCAITVATTR